MKRCSRTCFVITETKMPLSFTERGIRHYDFASHLSE
ncbi:hypothetical protein J2S16_004694 [Cytobacillus kochii]|nr:hypothetical protein [Cytobacillus kochii]